MRKGSDIYFSEGIPAIKSVQIQFFNWLRAKNSLRFNDINTPANLFFGIHLIEQCIILVILANFSEKVQF